MRKLLTIICFLVMIVPVTTGQSGTSLLTGSVSFISSQHIYVRFKTTAGISENDTLFTRSGVKLVPALLVNKLSSTSCLCSSLTNKNFPVGVTILAKKRLQEKPPETVKEAVNQETGAKLKEDIPVSSIARAKRYQQRIRGSISAASYIDRSNADSLSHISYRYRFSLNAEHIGGSPFSLNSYVTFRYKQGEWDAVKQNIFSAVKIYNLSLKYDIDSSFYLKLGRQMSMNIPGIGAFDGLELGKSFKRFSMGLIGGTRPDYNDYGFNPELLQYGAYLSYNIFKPHIYSGTSVALINQLASAKTDRRFIFLQYSGTLFRNLTVFSSAEIDLFRPDSIQTGDRLTSLYASISYRLSNKISLTGSYDARRNPIYYETWKTLRDTLFDNYLQSSYRLGTNIRLFKTVQFGIRASWRFLKSDPRQSKGMNCYITWNNKGMNPLYLTLSGNYSESSYISGLNSGLSFQKYFSGGKLNVATGYYYQEYNYNEGGGKIRQHTGRFDLYLQGPAKFSFSADYEIAFERERIYNRLYLQLMKRF